MQYLISKWKKFLVVFLMVVTLVAVSWEIMIPKILEIYLTKYLLKFHQYEMTIDNLHRENGKWVFDGPYIKSLDKGNSKTLNTAKSILSYKIDLWNGEIDLSIDMINPNLELKKIGSKFTEKIKNLNNSSSLIQLKGNISLQKGQVTVYDKTYLVDGVFKFGDEKSADFNIHLIDDLSDQNKIHVDLNKKKDLFKIFLDCDNVQCHFLRELLVVFYPEYKDISVKEGILNGLFGMHILQDASPLFHLQGTLKNFKFDHTKTNISGALKEIKFNLAGDPKQFLQTGNIVFSDDAKITDASFNDQNFWEISKVQGGIYFDQKNRMKLSLMGIYSNDDEIFDFAANGSGVLHSLENSSLDVDWKLDNKIKQIDGSVHTFFYKNNQRKIYFDLNQARSKEISIIQQIFKDYSPLTSNFKIQQGDVDLKGSLFCKNNCIKNVEIDVLKIKDLEIEYLPLNMRCFAEKVYGNAKLNLNEDILTKKLICNFNIVEGNLSYLLDKHDLNLTNINSTIKIDKGIFFDSFVEGKLNEMIVLLTLDTSKNYPLKLTLDGKMTEILRFIPDDELKIRMNSSFNEYDAIVDVDINEITAGFELAGQAQISKEKKDEKFIDFGFEVSYVQNNNTSDLNSSKASIISDMIEKDSLFKQNIRLLKEILPDNILPYLNQYQDKFLADSESQKFKLDKGWFKASHLPLKTYLSPFIVEESKLDLEGYGDFSANFDQHFLILDYEMQNAILHNNNLSLEVDQIRKIEMNPIYNQKPFHCVNLDTGSHFGVLPVYNGTYFEKNSGLLFTDVNAAIVFEGTDVYIPSLETFSNGMYMAGSLDVIFGDPHDGFFDVNIATQTIHGNLSQLQSLFSHFEKNFFFSKVPMDGQITLSKKGLINFSFTPKSSKFDAYFKGSLTDGSLYTNNSDVSLQEMSLNFEYDSLKNNLDFSDIQGTLLVGNPNRVEEYIVVGEKINFTDYRNNQMEFDVWVGDKKRDIIRVQGNTSYIEDKNAIQFNINKNNSHFGDVHPEKFNLVVKDWEEVLEFDLMADIKLASLFKDLQRFSRTGFFFLSRYALKQLNDINQADGLFKLDISYDYEKSLLKYHLKGDRVLIDSHEFDEVLLTGKKADKTWIIDQLKLDDISIGADILRKEDGWLVNFLGVQLENSLLVGLQGEYFDESETIAGKLNFLEINYSTLSQNEKFKSKLAQYPLKGILKAKGDFSYRLANETQDKYFKSNLDLSLNDWKIQEIRFNDVENIACEISSDIGVAINHLQTSILGDDYQDKCQIIIDKILLDTKRQEVLIRSLDFNIPHNNLFWMANECLKNFPDAFSEKTLESIAKCKDSGFLKGSLDIDYADPHYALKLKLQDDVYKFLDKPHRISNFLLEYDPCECQVLAKNNAETPYWFNIKSHCSDYEKGDLMITEENPSVQNEKNPLVIKWENHPMAGFIINQAVGTFHGASFSLFRNTSKPVLPDILYLEGEIGLNAHKAANLISKDLGNKLSSWQIGSGYVLSGDWQVIKPQNDKDSLKTYFDGNITGKNFEFKGFRFDYLTSVMHLTPNLVQLTNLNVKDKSGSLFIQKMQFTHIPKSEYWSLSIPSAHLQSFIPSRLQKIDERESVIDKPLVFPNLVLNDLVGVLGFENSFKGSGVTNFVNPVKKSSLSPLFSIPSEIISRIGLDLAVLNPVTGSISYEIQGNKIILTKLKDVYSQGRLSKFYLPNQSSPSYIDFDGNLQIQIRMKQYNLIFKFAELFTVTVRGTIYKPTYTLQKQK